jgi:hypothetical protein
MNGFRNKYCLSFFKAILFLVGLTFLVAQSSFKFYRFASFPFRASSSGIICHGAALSGAAAFVKHEKQGRVSLLLDKRYDFKHVFISPSPFCRLAALPAESNRYLLIVRVFFPAGGGQPVSMRGPPDFS